MEGLTTRQHEMSVRGMFLLFAHKPAKSEVQVCSVIMSEKIQEWEEGHNTHNVQ